MTLIDAETVIKEVELIATVGTATLAVSAPDSKIFITKGKCQHFPKFSFKWHRPGNIARRTDSLWSQKVAWRP